MSNVKLGNLVQTYIDEQLWFQVEDQVKAKTSVQVRLQVANLCWQVRDQVEVQVWAWVWDKIYEQR